MQWMSQQQVSILRWRSWVSLEPVKVSLLARSQLLAMSSISLVASLLTEGKTLTTSNTKLAQVVGQISKDFRDVKEAVDDGKYQTVVLDDCTTMTDLAMEKSMSSTLSVLQPEGQFGTSTT